MRTDNTNGRKQSKSRYKKIAIVGAVITAMFFIDVFTPVGGGQVKYYAKWIECGTRPQQESTLLGGHIEFHEISPIFSIWRDNRVKYFCTERQAEEAGLSSNPRSYEFPHLNNHR